MYWAAVVGSVAGLVNWVGPADEPACGWLEVGGMAGRAAAAGTSGAGAEAEAPEPGTPEVGAPEPGTPEVGAPEPGAPEVGAPEPGAPEVGTLAVDRPAPPAPGMTGGANPDRACWVPPGCFAEDGP
jgi:hypothetical protein